MSVVQLSALIISAFLFSSSSALNQHESELRLHYAHVTRIADFSCLQPQPRLISVHELFSESQANGRAYFPDVTVLHRCEECTGSCDSGLTCSVNKLELVLLPFKATFLNSIGKFRKVNIWRFKFIPYFYFTANAILHLLKYRSKWVAKLYIT